MFCALSENNQQLLEKKYASYKKMFKELRNGIQILVGQAVFKLQIKTVKMDFWINTANTTWSTLILMLFLSSLDNKL